MKKVTRWTMYSTVDFLKKSLQNIENRIIELDDSYADKADYLLEMIKQLKEEDRLKLLEAIRKYK